MSFVQILRLHMDSLQFLQNCATSSCNVLMMKVTDGSLACRHYSLFCTMIYQRLEILEKLSHAKLDVFTMYVFYVNILQFQVLSFEDNEGAATATVCFQLYTFFH